MIELTNVAEVLPGNNQRVTDMELSKIDKRHRQIVFPDDAGRLSPAHDPAENAIITHEPVPTNLTVRARRARQPRPTLHRRSVLRQMHMDLPLGCTRH